MAFASFLASGSHSFGVSNLDDVKCVLDVDEEVESGVPVRQQ